MNMLDWSIAWVASLFCTHFLSFCFFSNSGKPDLAKHAAMLSHEVCFLANGLVLTGLALQVYYFSEWFDPINSGSAMQRLHSSSSANTPVFWQAEVIVKVCLAFQIYDVIMWICRPDFRSWLILDRLGTSYVCMAFLHPDWRIFHLMDEDNELFKSDELATPRYAYFYAAFFLGVSEATNIPLAVFKALSCLKRRVDRSPSLSSLQQACKVFYPVLFIYIRCFWWPFEAVRMWQDCAELEIQYRYAQRYSTSDPRSHYSVVLVLCGLGVLQLFWGIKVCQIIYSITRGYSAEEDSFSIDYKWLKIS